MTKDELIKKLWEFKDDKIGITGALTAVDAYIQTLSQHSDVSGSLLCDHSDWVRNEDEDHVIITRCQKCGKVWRQ